MDRYLQHYGIKGMQWGVRRYENPDGTLTAAGKRRYANREEYVKKGLSANSDLERAIQADRKIINDLKKNGAKSKWFKEKVEGANLSDKDFEALNGLSKSKFIKETIKSYEHGINVRKSGQEHNKKVIVATRNTPINKKSPAEVAKDGERALKAYIYGGALATPVAYAIAYSKTDSSLVGDLAALLTFMGGVSMASVSQVEMNRKIKEMVGE